MRRRVGCCYPHGGSLASGFSATLSSTRRCGTSDSFVRSSLSCGPSGSGDLAVVGPCGPSGGRHRASPRYRPCGPTYSTLFSLLSCTGLRVSEAIHLRLDDVTPDGLLIRCTKFRKNRLVPLHETARMGLEQYLQKRRSYACFDDHVFVSLRRKPLSVQIVDKAFRTVVKQMGLSPGRGCARPTPHSFRHTFAVRPLETCPDARDAITKHMLALSTYLGHSKVEHTYWYLEAVPELMRDIADRAEQFAMGRRA